MLQAAAAAGGDGPRLLFAVDSDDPAYAGLPPPAALPLDPADDTCAGRAPPPGASADPPACGDPTATLPAGAACAHRCAAGLAPTPAAAVESVCRGGGEWSAPPLEACEPVRRPAVDRAVRVTGLDIPLSLSRAVPTPFFTPPLGDPVSVV